MIFFAHIAVGVWIALSPWLFGLSSNTLMLWNNVAIGLLLVIVNVWLIFGASPTPPSPVPTESKEKDRKNNKEKVEKTSF